MGKFILFAILITLSEYSFALELSIDFKCARTSITTNLDSIIPVAETLIIPFQFDEENSSFNLDFSRFDQFMHSDSQYAAECVNLNLPRLISAAELFCHQHQARSEQCLQNLSHLSQDIQNRYPLLSQENRMPLIIAGESYHGDGLARVAEALTQSCGQSNFDESALTSTFIEERLPGVLSGVPEACRIEIIEAYQNYLSRTPRAVKRSNTPSQERVLAGIFNVSSMLYGVIGEQFPIALQSVDQASCLSGGSSSGFGDLNSLINEVAKQLYCIPPSQEQSFSRDINIQAHDSPSGIRHGYRLNYENGAYHVELNLAFSSSSGIDSNPNRFKEIAESCLATTNGHIVGPNGEPLTIGLYQGDSNSIDSPPLNPISLSGPMARSNSNVWSVGIANDCPTIIHELLHLMGLCDEYPEASSGYSINPETGLLTHVSSGAERTEYDCRALGTETSIMRNQGVAYRVGTATGPLFTVYVCKSDRTDEECLRDGFPQIFPESEIAALRTPTARVLQIPYEHRGRGLLSPAHFNTIVYPGCENINATYYQCARAAYRTSSEVSRNADLSCPELPAECSNGNTAWLE